MNILKFFEDIFFADYQASICLKPVCDIITDISTMQKY